jgi:hypothetical protein
VKAGTSTPLALVDRGAAHDALSFRVLDPHQALEQGLAEGLGQV